jgi:hypothetical protein
MTGRTDGRESRLSKRRRVVDGIGSVGQADRAADRLSFTVRFDRSHFQLFLGKFGSIPLKDHHFGSIPLLSHLHVGPHESMTCEVHGIYLKFGSFNGIDPIHPYF